MNVVDVGSRLKLWSSGTATPLHHQDKLLITSHGCPRLFNRQFTAPANTTVIFYGPHGLALIDPGAANVASGWVRPYEIYGPGSVCPDYSLTKYQGYRSNVWAAMFGRLAKPFVGNGAETYEALEAYLQNVTATRDLPDILSIRATPGKTSLTLSFVLEEMTKEGYSYKQILCCFCRGITGGYKAPVSITIGGPVAISKPPVGEWEIRPPEPALR
jgi:hypothetical protein